MTFPRARIAARFAHIAVPRRGSPSVEMRLQIESHGMVRFFIVHFAETLAQLILYECICKKPHFWIYISQKVVFISQKKDISINDRIEDSAGWFRQFVELDTASPLGGASSLAASKRFWIS